MLRKVLCATALICTLALFNANAGAATFIGSQVTGTLLFPDISTQYVPPVGPVTVVDPGQEFPSNIFVPGRLFALDINASQITYFTNEAVTYGTSAFNGFKLSFSGAPPIVNVTLNGASTLVPVDISFDTNDVFLNLSGLAVTPAQFSVVDVTFGTIETPLPAALPLFATGLGALGLLSWRRKRKTQAAA